MLSNRDALATIITLECGKPIQEALAEVNYAASFLQWFSEEAKRVNGETSVFSNYVSFSLIWYQGPPRVGQEKSY